MKAKTVCPGCKEIVETDCTPCIKANLLHHACKGKKEPEVFEVTWEIVKSS